MKYLIDRHKKIWDPNFFESVLTGGIFFTLSLAINYYAISYASRSISGPVTDIVLSNSRIYDVDGLIIFMSLVLIVIGIIQLAHDPRKIPFMLKTLALFIVIRSIFISLTHLAPFYPHIIIHPSRLATILGLGSADDLFFSGHTGLPFLAALAFWDNKLLRYVFLAGSIILGISVLLGHLHYSIDVVAAFFITYSIFHIAQKLFPKDWQIFHS